jgi:hypothetical protein
MRSAVSNFRRRATLWRMDLRSPVGLLFIVLGALLAGHGLATKERAVADVGFNVNLVWGTVMIVFGALMWIAARLGGRRGRG